MNAVLDQIGQMRDFISDPLNKQLILTDVSKNPGRWHQLCSSLDLIEDAQRAQEAYLAPQINQDIGVSYLIQFGVLQALFAEQNAALDLCGALEIPIALSEYPRLERIRDIRNYSVGHRSKATKRKVKNITSHHFITPPDPKTRTFKLISWYSDGRELFEDIAIPSLVEEQEKDVCQVLGLVLKELRKREMNEKAKFKKKKLTSLFPDRLDYYLRKVCAWTTNPNDAWAAASSLAEIKKIVSNLEEELTRRGFELQTEGPENARLEPINYAVSELNEFFSSVVNGHKPKLTKLAADIFGFFLLHKVPELKKLAAEIDEYYNS